MADMNAKRSRAGSDSDDSSDLLASFHSAPSDAQRAKVEADTGAGKRWTPEQDDALRKAVEEFGQRNWKSIASRVPGRNHAQCLQRWNKVLKPGLVKGHWSFEEDSILEQMVLQGCHSWGEVAAHIPGRTAKQCRERWKNHLDPSINKGPFSPEEDYAIQEAFKTYGNRWTQIAELLPGRTEDAVKLRWKALNPHAKPTARPGRPKNPDGAGLVKSRSAAPPNPEDIAAAIMTPLPVIGAPPPRLAYPDAAAAYPPPAPGYEYTPAAVYPPPSPAMTHPSPVHHHHAHHSPAHHQHHHPHHSPAHQHQHAQAAPAPASGGYAPAPAPAAAAPARGPLASDLPEPIVEPQESKEEVDSKDAAILKELLRSFSNSMVSFEGSRMLASISDMSPEDLLASGELDEMLRQVSLANRPSGGASLRLSGRSSRSSRSSLLGATDSFTRSVHSMGPAEKQNVLQGLIDQLRASGGTDTVVGGGGGGGGLNGSGHAAPLEPHGLHELPMDSGLFTSFSSNSAKHLLHSLDYNDDCDDDDDGAGVARNHTIGLSPAVADATAEIDDLFDPSVMRTIRKGVQY